MLVCEDETIWGFGDRVQGKGPENTKLRKIEKDPGCTNFKKVVCGNDSRIILTKSGLLFCSGLDIDYALGIPEAKRSILSQQFVKMTNLPYDADDKIIDVSCGYNFIIVVTSSGKLYCQG